MRVPAENLCRQQCGMTPGVHSVSAHVMPARRLKCTAMAKGFADRSVANVDLPPGASKQRSRKKVDRRKRISHELEELQAAEQQISTRAPLPQSQQSNGSQPNSARPSQQQQQLRPEELESMAKKLQEEVLKLREEIRSSTFYRGFLATFQGAQKPAADAEPTGGSSTSDSHPRHPSWRWESVTHMVMYGLGSPKASKAARYQLAFALLITELLPGLREALDTYDPAFSDVDRALLASLGVTVHGTDEQCARVAQGQTLFYMPHCITAGFNNVLQANSSCLDRIAILGNSFLGYRISWKIARSQREEIMEILRLMEAKRIIEIPIEEGDMEGVSDRAFYRQSMHLFTPPG
ncbi:hypothetical protein CVIRNUC_000111 [Coccomyxa viridis]|uniref:SRR1-like domain-containing protein n=1 Tax=Coccomyxa viridis TaxID=1274662 RepID=A0AAV1HPY1_9CHLO|nr:hypothetical protein CVIRNUC_000111 [Coccomyxa viridis]